MICVWVEKEKEKNKALVAVGVRIVVQVAAAEECSVGALKLVGDVELDWAASANVSKREATKIISKAASDPTPKSQSAWSGLTVANKHG